MHGVNSLSDATSYDKYHSFFALCTSTVYMLSSSPICLMRHFNWIFTDFKNSCSTVYRMKKVNAYQKVHIHCCLFCSLQCCGHLLGKGQTLGSLLYVMFSCVFVTFPCDVKGQVWYLVVSIPYFFHLPYFGEMESKLS